MCLYYYILKLYFKRVNFHVSMLWFTFIVTLAHLSLFPRIRKKDLYNILNEKKLSPQ